MKSTVENLSPTRVKLAVEVPFDELRSSFDAAYKKIGSQVRIPGFRPGKVPAPILDRRIGRGAIIEEVVNDAIPKAYTEAVRTNELRALGQPEIEVTRIEDGDALEFTAEVDVRPELTIPALSDLSATVDDLEVTDEEIDEQISALRERFSVLTGVDRTVETGDFVSIDLEATVDGEPVEGGSTTGLSYEVGSDQLVNGLDDALVGLSVDEEKRFQTELVAGDQAGKTSDVTVTVRSVKVKELPELDDEFAQTASEFDTLEELRADMAQRLRRVKAMQQGAEARDRLVDVLLERVDVPVPESVLQAEVDARTHDVVHSFDHDEDRLAEWLQSQEKSREEFDAEVRTDAEKNVRVQLILDAIADAEEVGVDESDLTEHIVMQAQRYGMPPEEFAKQLSSTGSLGALVGDIRRNKALGLVLDAATVTDSTGEPIDLAALRRPQAPAAEAPAVAEATEGSDDADTPAADLDEAEAKA